MKAYTVKLDTAAAKPVVLEDMILTKDLPTAAGSRMLAGYRSLFDAEAVNRLTAAGYTVVGKAAVGEFAFDLLGESAAEGALTEGETLAYPAAAIVESDGIPAVCFDVNGAPRRAAAQAGLVYLKPTYGIVSRFGTVPVACSGETVGVMAKTAAECRALLATLAGHDDKDGTSLSEELCRSALAEKPITRVAVVTSLSSDTAKPLVAALAKLGVEVTEVEAPMLATAHEAWNILMSAELCNNVSRYDGVKYGYRSETFTNIDELYTNSRTEAFGSLLKTAILFGSETLSTENYMKVYDKALRIRRKTVEAMAELFACYDAVLLPATSKDAYTVADVAADPTLTYTENRYTAPASVTGLPSVVFGGAALVGPAFSEGALLALAERYEKEAK